MWRFEARRGDLRSTGTERRRITRLDSERPLQAYRCKFAGEHGPGGSKQLRFEKAESDRHRPYPTVRVGNGAPRRRRYGVANPRGSASGRRERPKAAPGRDERAVLRGRSRAAGLDTRTRTNRTEQSGTEQNRTEQNGTELNQTEPNPIGASTGTGSASPGGQSQSHADASSWMLTFFACVCSYSSSMQ
jgi:hypothetical protein